MLDNTISEYIGTDLDRVDTIEKEVKHALVTAIEVIALAMLVAVGIVAVTYLLTVYVTPGTSPHGFVEGMAAMMSAGLGAIITAVAVTMALMNRIRTVERRALDYWEEEGQIDYNPYTNGEDNDVLQ